MNSLERVLATVTGAPKDRPPLLLNLSLYGSRLTGHPLSLHYSRASCFVEGQIAAREAFGTDFVTSPFLVPALGEAFGSHARAFRDQAPNLVGYAARSAAEALKLPLPDVDGHPRILYLRECIRGLKAHFPTDVPIVGVLVSPMDLPILILGMEAWMEALLFDPDSARALVERCTEFCVALGNAMISDGATLLAFTANCANPGIVTRAVATGMGRASLEAFCAQLRSPLVLHHGGCRLAPFLDIFAGLPGVAAWFIDAQDSLAQARKALGEAGAILGNLHGPTLDQFAPEAIQAQCEAILRDRAGDPRFILASSGADIPLTTSPDGLRAIAQALQAIAVPLRIREAR